MSDGCLSAGKKIKQKWKHKRWLGEGLLLGRVVRESLLWDAHIWMRSPECSKVTRHGESVLGEGTTSQTAWDVKKCGVCDEQEGQSDQSYILFKRPSDPSCLTFLFNLPQEGKLKPHYHLHILFAWLCTPSNPIPALPSLSDPMKPLCALVQPNSPLSPCLHSDIWTWLKGKKKKAMLTSLTLSL